MRKGTPTKAAKSTRRPAKDARRLTREDWVEAALAALARGGVAAVAVEPLASELGATKGSFYWHFADRGELLKAVLERWVARDTDEVIAAMDALPDARAKLSAILSH
ncbi:MAG: TetR/AcrR family transcriptional regulator, partial [Myxococcales bacterium]